MTRLCIYQLPYGGGACNEAANGENHNPVAHEYCKGLDQKFCDLHEFNGGEGQHVIDARVVRAAAVSVADLAPPLAEALHLKAQDIFEAGERAEADPLQLGNFVVMTEKSVWLVSVGALNTFVEGRASWENLYKGESTFEGRVIGGLLEVGSRLTFIDATTKTAVTTGVITGVVRRPAA